MPTDLPAASDATEGHDGPPLAQIGPGLRAAPAPEGSPATARASKAIIIDLASAQGDFNRDDISSRCLEIKTRTRCNASEPQCIKWPAPFARNAVTLAG